MPLLALSWACFGGVLGCLVALLLSGCSPGLSWASLWLSWFTLGSLLASLGRLLASLGPPLGDSWASLGRLLASLGWLLASLGWLLDPSGRGWGGVGGGPPKCAKKGTKKGPQNRHQTVTFSCHFWSPFFEPLRNPFYAKKGVKIDSQNMAFLCICWGLFLEPFRDLFLEAFLASWLSKN